MILLLAGIASGQQAPLTPAPDKPRVHQAAIDSVLVYSDRAVVTRRAVVRLPKGETARRMDEVNARMVVAK